MQQLSHSPVKHNERAGGAGWVSWLSITWWHLAACSITTPGATSKLVYLSWAKRRWSLSDLINILTPLMWSCGIASQGREVNVSSCKKWVMPPPPPNLLLLSASDLKMPEVRPWFAAIHLQWHSSLPDVIVQRRTSTYTWICLEHRRWDKEFKGVTPASNPTINCLLWWQQADKNESLIN